MDLAGALDLTKSGITAFVGAGGKSTLLQWLCKDLIDKGAPFLLSSTTKMYYRQVAFLEPVINPNQFQGISQVKEQLKRKGYSAWFTELCYSSSINKRQGRTPYSDDKVAGVNPLWLTELHEQLPELKILVEADGARGKKIKAPADYEPVIPCGTVCTVGVLGLEALGKPLTKYVAHRLERLEKVLGVQEGALLGAKDLVRLIVHQHGLFKDCSGAKVLALIGNSKHEAAVDSLLQELRQLSLLRHEERQELSSTDGIHLKSWVWLDGLTQKIWKTGYF